MPKLFGVTLFISATLLFLVQPMVGKMILPLLGGTPAVWNTCMVFYQALLLAGYYYAHKTTGSLPPRRQVAVHMGVLLASAGVMAVGAALVANHSPVPVVKSLAPQGSSVPFFGVIGLLVVAIGLPFFTVSATAPLLQKWFSETGHPSAKDPYFLYAASNFGSLLVLVAYPFVVEPNLKLVDQAWLWAAGFVGLIALIAACGNAVKTAPPRTATRPNRQAADTPALPPPTRATKVRWLLLAFVPSSLMLAVNTDVTTDIVSMPLLWIVPLALYLLTFIIVFSKSIPANVHLYVTLMAPVMILLVVFLRTAKNVDVTIPGENVTGELMTPLRVVLAIELLMFFVVALACHGELARTRPAPAHLTEFYLIMSVGGMLGGLFNALVAPIAFRFVTEFPLTMVAACFLLAPLRTLLNPDEPAERFRPTVWDLVVPLLFFALARVASMEYVDVYQATRTTSEKFGFAKNSIATVLVFGIPALVAYFVVDRPVRFGACVGALWLGTFVTFWFNERKHEDEVETLYTRSYFGTMKVEESPRYARLVHGTTVHGTQFRDPVIPDGDGKGRRVEYFRSIVNATELLGASNPLDAMGLAFIAQPDLQYPGREPLSYYHRSGPVGRMFDAIREDEDPAHRKAIACIGLGTGSLSSYGLPDQKMTFFEIDTRVLKLVETPEYFTYIQRAKDQKVKIEFLMGDARLSLEQAGDRKWDFMLVDAFSSDAIPAHLLTKEAVELYFNRLSDDGVLALHVSNRYLRLEPVVERIVRELGGGYTARAMTDSLAKGEYALTGKLASHWIAVARKPEALRSLLHDRRWEPLERDDKVGLWTDDYTPILSVLQKDLFGRE